MNHFIDSASMCKGVNVLFYKFETKARNIFIINYDKIKHMLKM